MGERTVMVRFRGETWAVRIDRDWGHDPETNSHEIDWHFDGMTPEHHDALAITDAEEQDLYEQIYQALDRSRE